MNTTNYFDEQEHRCSILLNDFNQQLHWFCGMTANTRMSEIDYTCTDKKGRKCHVEIKERKGTIDKFMQWGDILIEIGKLHALARIMESGYTYDEQRLYINFVDDGVIIFNLNNIASLNYYPNHKQKNYGKKTVEHEDRAGLKMKDAIIYKLDYNGRYQRFKQWGKNK